jgi:outer membrane protein assembly factor BamB
LLYVPDQRGGLITVYEAGTGKQLYRERLSGAKGVTASPWAYDGKVFVLDESGQTYVLAAGKEFKVLGKNSLEGTFWASPAIAGGAVFIRASDHLFCVRP